MERLTLPNDRSLTLEPSTCAMKTGCRLEPFREPKRGSGGAVGRGAAAVRWSKKNEEEEEIPAIMIFDARKPLQWSLFHHHLT